MQQNKHKKEKWTEDEMKGKQKEEIRIKENETQLQPKSFKHLGKKWRKWKQIKHGNLAKMTSQRNNLMRYWDYRK